MKKICNLLRTNEQIIRYLIAGVATTFISLTSYYLLTMVFDPTKPIQLQIANIISWILSVLFAFVTNKKYVFKSKGKGKEKTIEMIKFYLSRLTTLFIDMATMWLLTALVNIDDKIAKLIVQVILVVLNYVFSKLFVFKKNSEK